MSAPDQCRVPLTAGVNSSALQLVRETAVHAGQGYRLRVAGVVRDYGMTERRKQAPEDGAALTGV